MSVENKVPEIRFRGFSGDWEKFELKNVSTYSNGGSFESNVQEEGRYELITLKSVDMEGNLVSSGRYIDIEASTLPKGTLVMILSEQSPGLLGMTAQIPSNDKYVLNQRVAEIRPLENIDSYLLSMAINKNQQYFSSRGAGTKVQNISKPNVESFEFLCPLRQEQTKIGNFFQQLDSLIAQHRQKHDKLLNIKKAMLEKMFPQQDEDIPEIRLKGFSGKWKICELGKHSIIKGRLGWKSLKQNEYLDDGPSMIAGRHIVNGQIKWNEVDHIPEWRYFESPEIMLRDNDVIFSKDGTLGNPAIIKNLQGYVTINSTMMLVRPGSKLNSDFFYQILRTRRFDDLIKLKVSGSSIPHLFQADMNEFSFKFPTVEEQAKIGNFFEQLDTLISQHQNQLTKLKNIKQSLLSKMFV